MIEVKLEPCPLCSSDSVQARKRYTDWEILCLACCCRVYGNTEANAAERWNTRAPHPSHAAVEAMEQALEEATQSLETIERLAGKKEEGLACFVDVRGYAHSRATVARKALAAYRSTQKVRP